MSTATKKTTAEDAYLAAHAEACGLLDRIGELLGDMPAPGNDDHPIHWGHVGDANHVVELLREVVTFLTPDASNER